MNMLYLSVYIYALFFAMYSYFYSNCDVSYMYKSFFIIHCYTCILTCSYKMNSISYYKVLN